VNILQINSSVRAGDAVSTELANKVVNQLMAKHPGAALDTLDLGQNPHPHLDGATLGALFTPADQRTDAHKARVAQDDALIAQVQTADTLVIGVPMYNFAIPVQLKSWFDAVARAGVTFKYTDQGAQGLLTGKKVYLALARGGVYRDTPNDTQVPYLKMMLGFLGMTDLTLIYAEGLAMGPQAASKGLAQAHAQINALFA
jgi:FMN-dependent NADH-azoreductase